MECYKSIQEDIRSGKLWNHIQSCCPESLHQFGIMVAVPYSVSDNDLTDEYENPTPISYDIKWTLKVILPCHQGSRKRSTVELLFDMLRSGH